MELPPIPSFISASSLDVYYRPKRFVSLDFETSNLEKGSALNKDNQIVLACWEIVEADGTSVKKHQWGDEYEMESLLADIRSADFVVAHNAKFELQWLRRCGLELRDVLVFDTYLAEWVIAGNRKEMRLGLEATARRYKLGNKVDMAGSMISMGINPKDIPKSWLLEYCYRDVELAKNIYYKQVEVLRRDKLMHLVLNRNLTVACLADIEFNGTYLDRERVRKEYESSVEEFRKLDATLHEATGGINLSSPKQLGTYLYDKLGFDVPKDHKGKPLLTGKGARKTDNTTLAMLKARTPEQQNFLDLYKRRNRLDSLITKNLEFFNSVVEQKRGKFYGIIQQGFTQTHRFSSAGRPILFDGAKKYRGIQYQNVPRVYKPLFVADTPERYVLECDGAQLEFRVAADLGKDTLARNEILGGYDVHSHTAKVLTDAGEPTSRQDAKAHTFAPLFGGMGRSTAQKAYAEAFKQKYKGISSTQYGWTLAVAEDGKLRTPQGMIFYWPDTKMQRSGYISNSTSIYNYPIQNFATGEIIPIALFYFWHMTRNTSILIGNTIHDSIVSYVDEDEIELAKQLSKLAFTTCVYRFLEEVYHYKFFVPLAVGLKVAKHWGDSKDEEQYTVYPDGKEEYVKK